MRTSRPIVVAIGIGVVVMSARVGATAEELVLQPTLHHPLTFAQEIETKFFDRAVGGTSVHTVRVDAELELEFAREAGALQVRSELLSSSQRVNGKETADPFAQVALNHPLVMELDRQGQAQRVVDIAGWVEPLQQSLMQAVGATQPIDAALIESGLLKNWNAVFGVTWALVGGRPLQLGTTMQFQGKLQCGLPGLVLGVTAIEEAPIAGSVIVTEREVSRSKTLQVRYTYGGEVSLDDEARAQLVTALGDAAAMLPSGQWSSASIAGTTEALIERDTLMMRTLTVEQILKVRGEGEASFREERTIKMGHVE